jgi:hypothetical protein
LSDSLFRNVARRCSNLLGGTFKSGVRQPELPRLGSIGAGETAHAF